jgi:hypothetical protein
VTSKEKSKGLSYFYTRKARYFIAKNEKIRPIQSIIKALKYDFFWQGPWRALAKLIVGRR